MQQLGRSVWWLHHCSNSDTELKDDFLKILDIFLLIDAHLELFFEIPSMFVENNEKEYERLRPHGDFVSHERCLGVEPGEAHCYLSKSVLKMRSWWPQNVTSLSTLEGKLMGKRKPFPYIDLQ